MKPITRKEYYLAKAAGTYTGPTPAPVLREDYYLATLAGDYSGNCPAPVTRLDMFMSAAAGLTSYVPQPITRIEKYWYAIAKGAGYVPEPVTREEQLLYAIIHKEPQYIDKTAEGSTILLTDSAQAPLNALTVYGHSTQSGTPSPDNPVPIVSAGDDGGTNISVSDGGTQSQTLTLSTPGGLPGIPVTSGGNYTDESGQQWVCDEVDFKRGVYVQRVKKLVLDGTETWNLRQNEDGLGLPYFFMGGNDSLGESKLYGYCNYFPVVSISSGGTEQGMGGWRTTIYLRWTDMFSTVEDLKSFLSEQYTSGNPVRVYYILATPIETDLPAEEIAAYKALHTYSPTTTVSNDAEAWMKGMKVGYKANP